MHETTGERRCALRGLQPRQADGYFHDSTVLCFVRCVCPMQEAQARIISNLQALYAGRDHNGDKLIEEISKEFFDNDHTYIPKHPLGV